MIGHCKLGYLLGRSCVFLMCPSLVFLSTCFANKRSKSKTIFNYAHLLLKLQTIPVKANRTIKVERNEKENLHDSFLNYACFNVSH